MWQPQPLTSAQTARMLITAAECPASDGPSGKLKRSARRMHSILLSPRADRRLGDEWGKPNTHTKASELGALPSGLTQGRSWMVNSALPISQGVY